MDNEIFVAIKARVSLRELMQSEGVEFRRSGATLTACCPIHREKTPSFHLHESAGGDWYKCFGCGAAGDVISYMEQAHGMARGAAVEALKRRAGLGGDIGNWVPPKRETIPEVPEAEVMPLDDDEIGRWAQASASLLANSAEIERIAAWRGFRPQTIRWAAERGLIGRVEAMRVWREAFLIERPTKGGEGTERIGWHVRLAPKTEGNPHDRAIWWYRPRKGLGAWPFVIWPPGGPEMVTNLFILEGQWDALALVDLFGWAEAWPPGVGVVGIRGATTWRRLMQYRFSKDVVAFLIGDGDVAGEGWFVPQRAGEKSFSEVLEHATKRVWAWRPNPEVGKDFNDLVKAAATEEQRELIRWMIRKVAGKRPGVVRKKIAFYTWLRGKEQCERFSMVYRFAKGDAKRRPRDSRRANWHRFVAKAAEPVIAEWKVAYAEWKNL